MKRNIELLTAVRDLINAEPAKLDMGLWASVPAEGIVFSDAESGWDQKAKVSCGTTACVAGWAVQLAGDKLLVRARNLDDGHYLASESVAKNGRVSEIMFRAQKLLGLTFGEADLLFMANDEDVVGYLDTLIAGNHLDYNDDDLEDVYGYEDDIPF